jgi:hypothetical protein
MFHAADGFLWQGFDRVNAWDFARYNPTENGGFRNEKVTTAMNDLSSEIIKADEYFASPETLTPEVMGALTVAIEVGRSFIAEAGAALDEVSQ